MPDIFAARKHFKPFEYPEVAGFKDAIRQSYWVHDEFSFLADMHDFDTALSPAERNVIKNALLAISQIEISVKAFWAKLGDRFPKPEISSVGMTCAESEVRHADAYSHLLEKLKLNSDFDALLENPVIGGRVDYLQKYIKGSSSSTDQNYTMNLALFSMFIENVSLFSQFLVIKAFNKHRNLLKDVDNVVQATQKEELIHAQLGSWLLNKIKEEHPEWFDAEFYVKLDRACQKAYAAESKVIDWIFETGDLPFLTAETVKEFTKDRFNESLSEIGAAPTFDIDTSLLTTVSWFKEEMYAEANLDFFNQKSTNYSKNLQAYDAEDLF
jgi:ribonucleoside-diphosphate reductase beta chain